MQRPVLKRKIAKPNGWTPQRRAAQSARTRADCIWLKSTGPRTPEGKARASANSVKTGAHCVARRNLLRHMHAALRAQGAFLRHLKTVLRLNLPDGHPIHAMLRNLGDQADTLLATALVRLEDSAEDGFLGRTL